MPVMASDIKFYKTTATGTDGITSLGGSTTSTPVDSALFDSISASEASSGNDTEYRAIDVKNENTSIDLQNAKIYHGGTSSGTIKIQLALDSGTQSITTESGPPTGLTFADHNTEGTALSLGTLTKNSGVAKRVWTKRSFTSVPAAMQDDGATLTVKGETV